MADKKAGGGEGNREADRDYRDDVAKTVESTTKEERARKARNISPEELKKAREAEKSGKRRAKG